MTGDLPLPPEVWQRMRTFFAERRTGAITLDVKDGALMSWEVAERGRVRNEHTEVRAWPGSGAVPPRHQNGSKA